MATLLLRLAGPLQSWGIDSKFDVRRTGREPSKSGVVGLLAAALGRKRNEAVDDLISMKMGIRIDQPGNLIWDFQMVHPDPLEKRSEVKSTITYRDYLSDAVFLVGMESEDKGFLEKLESALHRPAYPMFLGRRSCPVTLPLSLGIRDCDLMTALQNEKWLASDWVQKRNQGRDIELEVILDGIGDGLFQRRQKDVPKSYSPIFRKYGYRTVQKSDIRLSLSGSERNRNDPKRMTEHDAMSELE